MAGTPLSALTAIPGTAIRTKEPPAAARRLPSWTEFEADVDGFQRFLEDCQLNYYSLSVLTGAGVADIVPVGSVVSTLTWLEAGFGQFYIAVVVAQLVSLRFSQVVEQASRSDRHDSITTASRR